MAGRGSSRAALLAAALAVLVVLAGLLVACAVIFPILIVDQAAGGTGASVLTPLSQAESNGCTIAKQNTPPGRSTRAVSTIVPSTSSMSCRDMDATARSIQLSASGSLAASAAPPAARATR